MSRTAMAWALMWSVGTAAAGCRPAVEGPAVPSEVRYVAVIDQDGAGTAITDWPPGAPMPVVIADDRSYTVLGFTQAQLSGFGEAYQRGAVRPAGACEATLPAPAWHGRVEAGTLTTVAPDQAPVVTVDGLLESCPSEADIDFALDVRCSSTRCPYRVARAGCSIDIEAECGLGRLRGWIHPDGDFCLEPEPGEWTCSARPTRPNEPVVCTVPNCEAEVMLVPKDPVAPFEVRTVDLLGRTPYQPGILAGTNQLHVRHTREGYLYDLLILRGQVILSYSQPNSGGNCDASWNLPTGFMFLDPDTMEIRETVATLPCARDLAPHPSGTGFVGTFRDASEVGFAWFDDDGSQLMKENLQIDVTHFNLEISAVVPEQDRILAVAGPKQATFPPSSLIVSHRLSDLSPVRTATLADWSRVRSMAQLDDRRVVFASEADRFAWMDVERLEVQGIEPFPEQDFVAIRMLGIFVDPVGPTVVVPISAASTGPLMVKRFGEPTAEIRLPLSSTFYPSVVTTWPGGLWLVAGMTLQDDAPRLTQVALYDPGAQRFLPGEWTIGTGMPSRAVWDAEGRLWIMHAWSGEVTRLTPR